MVLLCCKKDLEGINTGECMKGFAYSDIFSKVIKQKRLKGCGKEVGRLTESFRDLMRGDGY
jgi:hypothetical protein